ncbi:MAG: type III-B CRISPR module-associated protein Cmr5 [bacterium]
MKTDTIKGIEQGRAIFAYQCAEKASTKIYSGEYKSYVSKVPIYIKTNGLGQTLAFIKSKEDKSAWNLIYNQIEEWLVSKNLINNKDDLVKQIVECESFKYRQLTNEVISFFIWLRRFADGLIAEQSKEQGNG